MNSLTHVLPAVDGGAAEIVRPDLTVTSPAPTLPDLGHLSGPRQESLRVWLLLEEAGDIAAAFLRWLRWLPGSKLGDVRKDDLTADLAGVPWLAGMLAGFVEVETNPKLIQAARQHLAEVQRDAHAGLTEFEYLADVFTLLEFTRDVLTEYVERFEGFERAECSTDADADRVAARFVDDFRGGAWAIDAAVKCLGGEFTDADLSAAGGRLVARLSRSAWLVATAEGGGR